jgi:hypothetical protein
MRVEVMRLDVSRDELALITTHLSGVASTELVKRPAFSNGDRAIVATKVSIIARQANHDFIERHSLNALLSLVERLALLGGRPFVEPLQLED